MKTILVATDGSDHAQRALELAADLANKYDGKLVLLHVLDNRSISSAERHMADVEFADRLAQYNLASDGMPGPDRAGIPNFLRTHEDRDAAIKNVLAEGILERAKTRANELGVGEVEIALESGDPAGTIVKAAEDRHANLIVIGSRGLSDLSGLVLGSVSHKVDHLSKINVITVR